MPNINHQTRTLYAVLEDGSAVEMTCSAPYEKAAAAMEAALRVLDAPIAYQQPVGLAGVISKWWRELWAVSP